MAEPAIALREHPQIVELFTVLEQNGLHQQKDEVQALVNYIDGMEDKLSRMVDEMTAMRKEVDRLHDKSIQAKCTYLMNTAENKVCQVRNMVSTAKSNTISAAVMRCRLCVFPQFSLEWSMAFSMPARRWNSVPDA